jgi:hypothetical protein
VAPASSSPAAREGRPRRWLFRRGAGAVGAKGGWGIFGRRSWSLGGAQAVADAGGTMDATAAASRAQRHGHDQCRRLGTTRGGSARQGRSSGPYRRRAGSENGQGQRGQARTTAVRRRARRVATRITAARVPRHGQAGRADSGAPRRACRLGKVPRLGKARLG